MRMPYVIKLGMIFSLILTGCQSTTGHLPDFFHPTMYITSGVARPEEHGEPFYFVLISKHSLDWKQSDAVLNWSNTKN